MIIQTEGLTITDNGQWIDIEEEWRKECGAPMEHIRITRSQAYGLLVALYAVCDKSVGEIEAEIGAE